MNVSLATQPLIVFHFYMVRMLLFTCKLLAVAVYRWVVSKEHGGGRAITGTYLGVSCHFDASIQELIKVLAELPRGGSQLAARPARGVDDLARGVVEFCCGVVEISLSLLECLTARGELHRQNTSGHTAGRTVRFKDSMVWQRRLGHLIRFVMLSQPHAIMNITELHVSLNMK